MLNTITVQGRCVKAIDLRYTQSQKPVASFTLACERDFAQTGEKREADFIDVVAFGNTADFCHKYLDKGSMAIISGRLQSREWTDKDGNKRKAWEIVADRVYFGESKKKDEQGKQNTSAKLQDLEEDDPDLPF